MLDVKATDRLRKLLAMTDAPNRHEAFSALMVMWVLLAKHGLKMRDVPAILHSAKAPTSRDESWATEAAQEHAEREQQAAEMRQEIKRRREAHKARAERQRKDAAERGIIIARYGSAGTVLAPCEREKLLRTAVGQWSTFHSPPDGRWTYAVDGYCPEYSADADLPERVRRALARAPLPQAQIQQLASAALMHTAHNLIVVGGTGTGKTHLATALGVAAIHHGKRVRFYNAVDLVSQLEREKPQGKAGNLAKQLVQTDAVILDELGYLPCPAAGGALLFHLISQLYEKTSLIVTTNLSFAEWVACSAMPR
jgi:DNA replication protein DnaC